MLPFLALLPPATLAASTRCQKQHMAKGHRGNYASRVIARTEICIIEYTTADVTKDQGSRNQCENGASMGGVGLRAMFCGQNREDIGVSVYIMPGQCAEMVIGGGYRDGGWARRWARTYYEGVVGQVREVICILVVLVTEIGIKYNS